MATVKMATGGYNGNGQNGHGISQNGHHNSTLSPAPSFPPYSLFLGRYNETYSPQRFFAEIRGGRSVTDWQAATQAYQPIACGLLCDLCVRKTLWINSFSFEDQSVGS